MICRMCKQERPDAAEVIDPYDDAYGFGRVVPECPFCYAHRALCAAIAHQRDPERVQLPASPFDYPKEGGGDEQVG